MFTSDLTDLGAVTLPPYTGARVMMQPFRLEQPATTLPNVAQWVAAVRDLISRSPIRSGVGYLTIDESEVAAGETHRRPGLHVDGVGEDGRTAGGWGGGGKWGACGMIVAASHVGCRAWRQTFAGAPGPDGDCEHLTHELDPNAVVYMKAGHAYQCGPLTVHETLRAAQPQRRQFVRISMPSSAPWFEGYTRSPVGVQATGPVLPPRAGMMFRAS